MFCLSVLGLVVFATQPATAALQTDPIASGVSVKLDWPYKSGLGTGPTWPGFSDGGPFWATVPGSGTAVSTFLTFCVEPSEYFLPGATYTVTSVDPSLASASNNAVLGPAKWLYLQFRLAQAGDSYIKPAGYDLKLADDPNVGALVQAIVWANTLVGGAGGTPAYQPSLLSGEGLDIYNAIQGLNTSYVGIFNPGVNVQSQLYISSEPARGQSYNIFEPDRDPNFSLPEPGSVLIWAGCFGAAFLAWKRRGNRQQAPLG